MSNLLRTLYCTYYS